MNARDRGSDVCLYDGFAPVRCCVRRSSVAVEWPEASSTTLDLPSQRLYARPSKRSRPRTRDSILRSATLRDSIQKPQSGWTY